MREKFCVCKLEPFCWLSSLEMITFLSKYDFGVVLKRLTAAAGSPEERSVLKDGCSLQPKALWGSLKLTELKYV